MGKLHIPTAVSFTLSVIGFLSICILVAYGVAWLVVNGFFWIVGS